MKEISISVGFLSALLLIVTGIMYWMEGAFPAGKFMVASGLWIKLHLLHSLQKERFRQ
ncbi:MAG: hypothetical protein KDD01_02860 [Phaeodactylibacter sp.]|nr:hypothetical protein [Phaeodactylibacter sp.]